jgi:chaperonin GroES
MSAKFKPCDGRLLISVIDQERILEGVLMPDSSKEDAQVGKVIAVGESQGQEFTEGDIVLFGPWAGKNIQLEGIPFRVMREGEIDGKIGS